MSLPIRSLFRRLGSKSRKQSQAIEQPLEAQAGALPAFRSSSPEIRRLQLRSHRLVSSTLLGQYRSTFRGSGLVFSDIREYEPGDDVKHIHWKVTARTGQVYVKAYEEERQLRVVVAVDVSASMFFPRGQPSYSKLLEFCSVIGSLTQRSNDLLGTCLFDSGVKHWLPPKSGASGSKALFSLLAAQHGLIKNENFHAASDIKPALQLLQTSLRKPTLIFIVSDFHTPPFDKELTDLSARHDVVLVHAGQNPEALPSVGLISLVDAETGRSVVVDSSNQAVQKAWVDSVNMRSQKITQLATRCGADAIDISRGAVKPLAELMRSRALGKRRAIRATTATANKVIETA